MGRMPFLHPCVMGAPLPCTERALGRVGEVSPSCFFLGKRKKCFQAQTCILLSLDKIKK